MSKLSLQQFLLKQSVRSIQDIKLPFNLQGLKAQTIENKVENSQVTTEEELRPHYINLIQMFEKYVQGLQNTPGLPYEDWMDYQLYLQTQKALHNIQLNNYTVQVMKTDSPSQLEVLKVKTYRGVLSDRLYNLKASDYEVEDLNSIMYFKPKIWQQDPQNVGEIDQQSYKWIKNQMLLRVMVQVHSGISVKLVNKQGGQSGISNIHTAIFENQLNQAPKFSHLEVSAQEWLRLNKLSTWKLINVDQGFDDWPLALNEKQYGEITEINL